MMTVRVKICGLRDRAGLDAACEAGADWVGFVFFARSPRHVTAQEAGMLARTMPKAGPQRIGLFVRPTDVQIAEVLDHVPLDGLQIYDDAARATAIRARFGLPVWLAAGIASRADLPQACAVDRLVIESRPPTGSDRPGGNAHRFDWVLTQKWQAPVPCCWQEVWTRIMSSLPYARAGRGRSTFHRGWNPLPVSSQPP